MNQKAAKILYQTIQKFRGEPVFNYLRELEKSQWWPETRLRKLQWEKFIKLITYAYENVKHYRTEFNRLVIKPDQIKSFNDITKLPILSKATLREKKRELVSKDFQGCTSNWVTSGSSGDPVSVVRSRKATGYHHAAMYRARRWFGINIGDREARLWGIPVSFKLKIREQVKDFLMNRTRASAYELNKDNLSLFLYHIKRFKPVYLFGYASLVYEFARFILDENIDVSEFKFKGAITTSETLYDFQRQVIEKAFHCPVINEYGSTETGIIAYQCPKGGMHIPVEAVYVEVIPDKFLGNGLGRVLVTDLNNYAVPIIRYDIGDIATLSDEKCLCGRELPLMSKIAGRDSSIITLPNGNKIHTILFYYIMCGVEAHGGGVKQFQVIQRTTNKFTMMLVKDNSLSEERFQAMKDDIKKVVGPKVVFNYELVDHISRTEAGKLRDFIPFSES